MHTTDCCHRTSTRGDGTSPGSMEGFAMRRTHARVGLPPNRGGLLIAD